MVAIAAIGAIVAARAIDDAPARGAFFFATTLATFNGVAALALAAIGSRSASTKGFFASVFGGMVARMATSGVGILVAVKFWSLPAVTLAVSFLAFTALFTVFEVALWSRQTFSPRTQLS